MDKHILVFDSGLGGTTILDALRQRLPGYRYSYAMDNGAFPYGDKTDDFLRQRIQTLFDALLPQAQPDLVVIACNTASTLILDVLRARHSIPFVGVVPAIKPAAATSHSQVIALLATPATLTRDYIDQLSMTHANHCQVIRYAHPDLVAIAENKMLGHAVDRQQLANILAPLKQQQGAAAIDTFVLGCTHFPAIADELAMAWGSPARWIDSGQAIARRVGELLGPCPGKPDGPAGILFLSAPPPPASLQKIVEKYAFTESRLVAIGDKL